MGKHIPPMFFRRCWSIVKHTQASWRNRRPLRGVITSSPHLAQVCLVASVPPSGASLFLVPPSGASLLWPPICRKFVLAPHLPQVCFGASVPHLAQVCPFCLCWCSHLAGCRSWCSCGWLSSQAITNYQQGACTIASGRKALPKGFISYSKRV